MIKVEIFNKSGIKNPQEEDIKSNLSGIGIDEKMSVRFVKCFYFSTDKIEQVEQIIRDIIIDPIIEEYEISQKPYFPKNIVEYAYKPGVMDPVILTLKETISHLGILYSGDIKRSFKVVFPDSVSTDTIDYIAKKLLINSTVQYRLNSPPSFREGTEATFNLVKIDILSMNDSELEELSDKMVLSLNLEEMKTIKNYFKNIGRIPTDVELETIAQTWSEHCKHKTLNGNIEFDDEIIEGLLKNTVFKATTESKRDFLVSVFEDNAGIIKFDKNNHICFKVETHNHPSALEPYGGAETGIGGVIRDIMGTGRGAKPIANTDVFCFATPEYPYSELPTGILHPRRVAKGVVSGVRDYGNRMGIPTINGSIHFHNDYLGNPLVFCGSIGIMPVGTETKKVSPGEKIVLVGGRTGKDGIHGATFSSVSLHDESEVISSNAVQIGNAITEKKVLDALLEARDRELYTAITDCGAGGLSSAVGEMGEKTGANVELSKVPLKYRGLTYSEIWISEAQERMVISVKEENLEEIKKIFDKYNVESTVIGDFTDDKKLRLSYNGNSVLELDMEFLHKGVPKITKKARYIPRKQNKQNHKVKDIKETIFSVLGNWTIASKEWVIRQYDHEVQGKTVGKPLSGKNYDGPQDASVLKPLYDSYRGIVVANGINVRYGILDPYKMAQNAIDEAIRNIVSVGGDPEYMAILDNYSFGNPDREEILGDIVMASKGMYDAAKFFDIPFISGKDSLYNEFKLRDKTINIPPTILISAISVIDDIRTTITSDFKSFDNPVYIIGDTFDEMGGSILYDLLQLNGGIVPAVNLKTAKQTHIALYNSIKQGIVSACHDISEGGIALSAIEMAIGGRCGFDFDLSEVVHDDCDFPTALFSESATRYIVEVKNEKLFLEMMKGIPIYKIGYARDGDTMRFGFRGDSVHLDLKTAIKQWKRELV